MPTVDKILKPLHSFLGLGYNNQDYGLGVKLGYFLSMPVVCRIATY